MITKNQLEEFFLFDLTGIEIEAVSNRIDITGNKVFDTEDLIKLCKRFLDASKDYEYLFSSKYIDV